MRNLDWSNSLNHEAWCSWVEVSSTRLLCCCRMPITFKCQVIICSLSMPSFTLFGINSLWVDQRCFQSIPVDAIKYKCHKIRGRLFPSTNMEGIHSYVDIFPSNLQHQVSWMPLKVDPWIFFIIPLMPWSPSLYSIFYKKLSSFVCYWNIFATRTPLLPDLVGNTKRRMNQYILLLLKFSYFIKLDQLTIHISCYH